MGSGTGGDKGFVAVVSVKIDEASLASAGRAIQESLKKATEGIDLKAFRDIAEAAKLLAAQTDNMAKAEAARSTAKRESVALAKAELDAAERALNAELNLAKIDRQMAEDAKVRAQGLDAMAQAQRELNALLQQQGPLEKDLQTKLEAQLAAERDGLKLVAQTIDEKKRLAALNKAEEEAAKKQAAAEKEIAALTDKQLSSQTLITQTENARVAANDRLAEAMAEQKTLLDQQAATAERIKNAVPFAQGGINPAFNLGNLGGALGNNFLTTLLSGGGLSSALSQSLGQLQPALFGIAQGGQQATAAFNALGIEGTNTVSALTQGMAGLATGALLAAQAAGSIGQEIGKAYEQQKEFVFQSGILAKQLGTTAEEGAKLRSLLTLVGQEDNIFAAITLNQIQASVAALDRVNKGLEKASPQVEKFGQALTQLGVSYQNQNGSLKTFADLVVDISAGLQNLSTAQRSLAIQNLAGLFGSDVAKIFGFGPDGLTTVLQNAVIVTNEQQQANDRLQVSLVGLTNAQTEFNIALTNGITPLDTFSNTVKAGAFKEATDVLGDFFARFGVIDLSVVETRGEQLGRALVDGILVGLTEVPIVTQISQALGGGKVSNVPSTIFDSLFPSEAQLKLRAEAIKTEIANVQRDLSSALPGTVRESIALENLRLYEIELEKIRETLNDISADRLGGSSKTRGILPVFDEAPSVAALTKNYKDLLDAVKDAQKAEKELRDVQKEISRNNQDVAKSFDAQIEALQKTGEAYDSYYTKIGGILEKIDVVQAKAGKPYTVIGTGTVKDVEKAIVDLRVLEERLTGFSEKGLGPGAPKFDQLALNIKRRREALGLQPGELTDIANVDITVGITDLSRKDREAINQWFQEILQYKKEFLQGGFDVAQSVFGEISRSLAETFSIAENTAFLQGGADVLQNYANTLGLFASPGFAQAIGEAGLRTKFLTGAFGDVKDPASFERYVEALGGLRQNLFDLSDFIADPTKLGISTIFKDLENYTKKPETFKLPIAIELGLVTEAQVQFAGQDVNKLFGQGQTGLAQQVLEARKKVEGLGTGKGLVDAILAQYGVTSGEAIEAALDLTLDLNVDDGLVQKEIKAQNRLAEELSKTRNINAKWNLNVDVDTNLDDVALYIKNILDLIGAGESVPKSPTSNRERSGIIPGSGRAAGGPVFRGMPTLVGEEGKPEFFIPRSDGRIIPGNETASLMRLMAGSERMPAQPIINYSPVVQQYLTVDARGTNARDVTAAIQRTQAKQTLFTSSSALVRDRDFLRAHGIR